MFITLAPMFSTRRMVKEYVNHLYIPGEIHGQKLAADGYAEAKRLAAWKHATLLAWPQVQVQLQSPLDGQVKPGQIRGRQPQRPQRRPGRKHRRHDDDNDNDHHQQLLIPLLLFLRPSQQVVWL